MGLERRPDDAAKAAPDDRDWPLPAKFDRRRFVVGVATVAGAALAGWPSIARRLAEAAPDAARARTFTPEEWRTMAAAVDRLLPSGPGSPGARDVNAVGYLDAVLADPATDPARPPLVKDGAARLLARARARGASSFDALPPDVQDAAIRAFEATAGGRAWLDVVLGYVLEAFLGSPVHGGNPGEIAWAWAGIKPGVPRLGADGKPVPQ